MSIYGERRDSPSSLKMSDQARSESTAGVLPGAGRDRYFDLLRAAAIVRVVAFHMFPVAWLSMIFPAMGVMFALGGSLMAGSVDRSARRAVTGRLRRLLPALWVVAVIIVPLMLIKGWPDRPSWVWVLLWVFPLGGPPAVGWAEPVTGLLWYLVTYLWLVLLSPALMWLYRKARLAMVLLPLASLAVLQAVPWFLSDAAGSVLTDVLTFGSCWVLGFAHRDGDLRRVPAGILVTGAVLSTAGGLAWAITHPAEQGVDLSTVPLAYGFFSAGFVMVLLRFTPPMGWLSRRRITNALVNLLNARAVTIYLWHNAAIAACFSVGDYLHVWRIGDRFATAGYMAVATVLLAIVVTAVGWVEDVAAFRRVRLLPVRPEPRRTRRITPEWSGPVP